jgi:Sec-independent protein secretion pathway component TatC
LIAAILLEIPIAMIFLSRVLRYRSNRWANIIAGAITIVFVIGGGSTDLHYIFFATIEVVTMALIVWYAWKWPKPESRS